MSVSTHLSPEPERRLLIILESMRQAAQSADGKAAALTALAAAEAVALKILGAGGVFGGLALILLAACLPLGALAFSPLTKTPKWLPFLEPPVEKSGPDDCLLEVADLAKATRADLTLRLDRYLGGGVTATVYYEDVVGQIILWARTAARKQILLDWLCRLVLLGQAGLSLRLLLG